MNTIEEHINSINTKLQLLLKKYAILQKENSTLSYEIETCRKNDKEKHDFEKRINQYIKELDKCMTMLNN
jgi:hypothetical protein